MKRYIHNIFMIAMKNILVLIMSLSCSAYFAYAQGNKVTGTVNDNDGEPLAGATVIIKGVNRGAVTDQDGRYVLSNVDNDDILVFSFLGMKTIEMTVGNRTVIDATMEPDETFLDETVVIGYSEVRYKDLTGSVGKADIDDMLKTDAGNIAESFAGRVAGVQVSSNEGMPGAEMNIIIRGNNSVTQSNSPLYVIDGFPLEDASLNTLNPSDIASISILKDASATAIYGARAANGVVIVTTKMGQPGAMKVSFDASWGFADISKKIPLMNAYEFVCLQKEIMTESDFNNVYLRDGATIEDYRNVRSIDWQDQVFQRAPLQKYSLNLSGGNRSTRYSTTLSIYDQDGIIKNSNYSRYQGRSTVDHRFGKGWHIQYSVNFSRTKQTGDSPSQSNYTGSANLLPNVWSYRPFASIGDDDILNEWIDSTINPSQDYRVNPIYIVTDEFRTRINNNFRANAYVEYEIIKGLKIKVMGGFLNDDYSDEIFNGSHSRTGNRFRSDGVNASSRNKSTQQWVNENTLTYKTTFDRYGRHNFDVLVGQTMQGSKYTDKYMRVTHIPDETLGMNGMGQGQPVSSTYTSAKWSLMSFLSRINYNYDNRYYFTATFRADGSSMFSRNKWGYFPSGAFAWSVGNERFMQNQDIVQDLKLRVSYGLIGNQGIGRYDTLGLMESIQYTFGTDKYYNGYWPGVSPTPDLKWETTRQFDAGIDVSFWNSRVNVTLDYFYKMTHDGLIQMSVPDFYGGGTYWTNAAQVNNRGFEFMVDALLVEKGGFSWNTTVTGSTLKNNVVYLADGLEFIDGPKLDTSIFGSEPVTRVMPGHPIGAFYGYVWTGLDENGRDTYLDMPDENGNVDGIIDSNDRTWIGDPNPDFTIGDPNPDFTLGWNNTFRYRNWTLNLFFSGSFGADKLNAVRFLGSNRTGGHYFFTLKEAWDDNFDNKGQAGRYPGVNTEDNQYYVNSTKYIESADYFRLENLSLSYTLPKRVLKFAEMQLRFSCQNVFTITGYKGVDPAAISSYGNIDLNNGLDLGVFPLNRSYTFGVRLNF